MVVTPLNSNKLNRAGQAPDGAYPRALKALCVELLRKFFRWGQDIVELRIYPFYNNSYTKERARV
nr:CLL_HP1_G0004490.mRNA.1.CDS.1 [Saccharomyces cerevisiae]